MPVSLGRVSAGPFRVCYTGESPPPWALQEAAAIGVEFVPLGADGAAVTQAADAARRLALLQPAGYLMNHPCYGPYLSAALADAAGGALRIVTYLGATREPRVYEAFMDVAGLRDRKVVLTAPALPSLTVAESALTLLLALELGLVPAHLAARAGDAAGEPRTRSGLFGSTLGVVGLGQVGQRVAQLAAACGMRVCYTSRTRRPDLEDLLGIEHLTLTDLVGGCSYVSVHTPIITTRGLIGRAVLSGAHGISLVNNTSDPCIVEPFALLAALRSGRVRQVAVEGCYPEPHQRALREFGAERVLLLPAYASWGNSRREQTRTWQQQLETYRALLAGRRSRDELA